MDDPRLVRSTMTSTNQVGGWKVISAKVTGFSHQSSASPCQDHVAFELVDLGSQLLIAVLCDGAGSATRAEFGAWFIAETLVSNLARAAHSRGSELLDYLHPKTDRALKEFLKVQLAKTRSDLRCALSKGEPFDEYNCTLVGAVVGPEGGAFFHVGDGVGIATKSTDLGDAVSSDPENGEYINETYFCTETDWPYHFRVTTFDSSYDIVCLLSDGAASFMATAKPSKLAPSIAAPVTETLRKLSPQEGSEAFVELFSREKIRSITGDDKSILWAMRC